MASNIISTTINENFPIAGQDNDSQGFRDNFNVIKTSLATAKTEITAIQNTASFLNATSDYNGNIIQEADFLATTHKVYGVGNVVNNININWSNGSYQTVQVGADITITLTAWPATGKYGIVRVVCTGDGIANSDPLRTITWAATGGNNIRKDANFPTNSQVQLTTKAKIFDFWTSDAGQTVYAQYIGEFA
tara:strand:- start:294 stop:866 length:573 start_codon:yes stop_codon:yes gene_type:complete